MSRKANYPAASVTFRLPLTTLAWLDTLCRSSARSRAEVIRCLLSDLSTCFGMAQIHARTLEQDREALGLAWRDYLLHLLARRFEVVQSRGAGFDRGPTHSTIAKAS